MSTGHRKPVFPVVLENLDVFHTVVPVVKSRAAFHTFNRVVFINTVINRGLTIKIIYYRELRVTTLGGKNSSRIGEKAGHEDGKSRIERAGQRDRKMDAGNRTEVLYHNRKRWTGQREQDRRPGQSSGQRVQDRDENKDTENTYKIQCQ